MSREIKFRAWDKNTGSMLSVQTKMQISHLEDGQPAHYLAPAMLKFSERPTEESFDEDGNVLFEASYVLMQFTGLKDKNGREIYEGDVLQYPSGVTGVVEYDTSPGTGCYSAKTDTGQHLYFEKFEEVIGNIYENPELMGSPAA